MERYSEIQFPGTAVASGLVFLSFAGIMSLSTDAPVIGWLILLFAVLLILLFGMMKVRIDTEVIRITFGVGLVGFRFPLTDFSQVRQVRNRWYFGWGIRVIPGGFLYNIKGLDAIELTRKNGNKVRIGTEQPQHLVQALADLGIPRKDDIA